MSAQFALPGFDAEPKLQDRLFFALFPDLDTAAQIGQLAKDLRKEHGLTEKPIEEKRLHVPLHHLGDHAELPNDIVASATKAGASVLPRQFDVSFDRVMSFGKKRNNPLVLRGADGLDALMVFQKALGVAMMKVGLAQYAETHFTPHVTLLYGHTALPEQVVENITWTVREFVLVHSLLGRHMHVPLARWPLA